MFVCLEDGDKRPEGSLQKPNIPKLGFLVIVCDQTNHYLLVIVTKKWVNEPRR